MIAVITAKQPFSHPEVHKTARVALQVSVRDPFAVSEAQETASSVWFEDEPVNDGN